MNVCVSVYMCVEVLSVLCFFTTSFFLFFQVELYAHDCSCTSFSISHIVIIEVMLLTTQQDWLVGAF